MQRSLPAWQLPKVLEPFKVFNRTVKHLDLSHNSFDQTALDELALVLIQNCVLSRLEFQNFGFPEPAVFESFVKKLLQRGAPLEILLPRVDMEDMLRTRAIDIQGLLGIIILLNKVAQGDSTVPLVPNSQTCAAVPPDPSYRIVEDLVAAPAVEQPAHEEKVQSLDLAVPKASVGPGPGEWEVTFATVPLPDNSRILADFHHEFNVETLLLRVRGA
jgi:hypothetical protein